MNKYRIIIKEVFEDTAESGKEKECDKSGEIEGVQIDKNFST